MINTELTHAQLSEVAGGPAYGMDNSSFTSNKLEHGPGLHDSVHCFKVCSTLSRVNKVSLGFRECSAL